MHDYQDIAYSDYMHTQLLHISCCVGPAWSCCPEGRWSHWLTVQQPPVVAVVVKVVELVAEVAEVAKAAEGSKMALAEGAG